MPYQLRMKGRAIGTYDTQQEAVEAAKHAIAADPEAEPEVIDLDTGAPAAPGADEASREQLRNEVGF